MIDFKKTCEGLFAWRFAKSMQNRCFQKRANKYIPNLYSGANNLNRKSISVILCINSYF